MKYYVKDSEGQAITGPFELDEIRTRLKAGGLPDDTLATGDIGEGLARIRHAPPEDWMPVRATPGLSLERLPTPESSPPKPPPNVVNMLQPPARAIGCCPACGHRLAPDPGNACDHCGKELIADVQESGKPAMPSLDVKQQAIYAIVNKHLSSKSVAGETGLPECAESLGTPEKKAVNPPPLVSFIAQVIGGVLAHFISFVLLCGFFSIGKSRSLLLLVAVVHCVAWIAVGIWVRRDQTERGFAFGIFIGVGLTALLTANCSMK